MGSNSSWYSYFNGTDFVNYNTTNSPLPNNFVYDLEFDSNNVLWIGSNGGLTRFDGTNWNTYHSANSGLSLNLVRTIAIESSLIWIGTEGQGLSVFDVENDTWSNFNLNNSNISSNYINKIDRATDNKKWIATTTGIDVR